MFYFETINFVRMQKKNRNFLIFLFTVFSFILLAPAASKILHHCEHDHVEIDCKNHKGEHLHSDNKTDCDFCKFLSKSHTDLSFEIHSSETTTFLSSTFYNVVVPKIKSLHLAIQVRGPPAHLI